MARRLGTIEEGRRLGTIDEDIGAPIDFSRPKLEGKEPGEFATEETITVEIDNKFLNIPTIIDGRRVSNEEAIKHAKRTGENVGVFDTQEEAISTAERRSKRIGELRGGRRLGTIEEGRKLGTLEERKELPFFLEPLRPRKEEFFPEKLVPDLKKPSAELIPGFRELKPVAGALAKTLETTQRIFGGITRAITEPEKELTPEEQLGKAETPSVGRMVGRAFRRGFEKPEEAVGLFGGEITEAALNRGLSRKLAIAIGTAGGTVADIGLGILAEKGIRGGITGLNRLFKALRPKVPTTFGVIPDEVIPKKAGRINLERLPEEVRRPIAEVVKDKPSIGATPKITNAETIKRAAELRDTPTVRAILAGPEGEFAAEVLKARQGNVIAINQILTRNLDELSASIKTDLEAPIKAIRRVGAETGRALQQQKITPFAKQNIIKKILKKKADIAKDPLFERTPAARHLNEQLDQLKDVIAGGQVKPGAWDQLYFGWLNAILSDPRTHMVNVGSNAVFALMKIPERFLSAVMDVPLTALGKAGIKRIGKISLTGERQVFFRETPALIKGFFKKGVKTPRAIGSKFEQLSITNQNKMLPTTLLQFEDNMSKDTIGRMELFAQLARRRAQGGKGLLGVQAIKQEQLIRTFQQQPGVIAKQLLKLRNVPFIGKGVVRWIVPFVKTPANIINEAIKRNPAGVVFLGKATTQAQLSERLALLAQGSMVSAWAGMQYLKGNLTGDAPKDPAERDAFFAQGKQPNAIRLFGNWIPFERIEPIGTSLALTVNAIQDFKDSDKEIPFERVMDAVGGMAQSLTNKSFTQGLTNMMKAISDPDRFASAWQERMIAGFATPGFLNFLAQLKDPTIRQPRGVIERIKSRIPGLSEQVPPKLTVFGEEVKRPTPILPFRISKVQTDNVREELENIGKSIGFPSKIIGKKKLSQREFTDLLRESGRNLKRALEFMITQPKWQTLSDTEKIKEVDKLVRKVRELPREKAALTILLTGIDDAKTDEELQSFLAKMKEAKVLTKERFNTLTRKGILGR